MNLYKSLMMENAALQPEGIRVNWLGTAGVWITDGETRILIDPYVSRFSLEQVFSDSSLEPDLGLIRSWAEKLGGKGLSAVIVSHSHFDHLADAPYFAVETGAPLIGTESTLNAGRGAGLPETRLLRAGPEQSMAFGKFTVSFIESAHGLFQGAVPYPGTIDEPLAAPAPASAYRLGGIFSLVIRHPLGTILHHGSAGFKAGMYEGISGDVLLLGITGIENMDGYLDNVALKSQAKIIIPIHMDNFFEPLERGMLHLSAGDLEKFCQAAQKHRERFAVATLPFCREVALRQIEGSDRNVKKPQKGD